MKFEKLRQAVLDAEKALDPCDMNDEESHRCFMALRKARKVLASEEKQEIESLKGHP